MKTTTTIATLTMLLIAACGGDKTASSPGGSNGNGGGGGSGSQADASTGSGGAIEDAGHVHQPDIDAGDSGLSVGDDLASKVVGSYALRMVVATITDLPVLGKSHAVSTSYGVATIARDGAGLTITQSGCHVDASSGSTVTTTIPDAIPKSVPPATDTFRVWKDGSDVKFACISKAIAVGVKLADPENDALPKDSTDPRVWDQDGDGKPGVTVKVSGVAAGDIYVVQRQKTSYEGTMAANGTMPGLLVDNSEQSVVGSSNPLLNQNVAATPDDPSKSTVTLVKLPSAYDCTQLMANVQQVFP